MTAERELMIEVALQDAVDLMADARAGDAAPLLIQALAAFQQNEDFAHQHLAELDLLVMAAGTCAAMAPLARAFPEPRKLFADAVKFRFRLLKEARVRR